MREYFIRLQDRLLLSHFENVRIFTQKLFHFLECDDWKKFAKLQIFNVRIL